MTGSDAPRMADGPVDDDLTPVAALPEDSPFRTNDPKRAAFADEPAIPHLEVVAPDLVNSALVGTRPGRG